MAYHSDRGNGPPPPAIFAKEDAIRSAAEFLGVGAQPEADEPLPDFSGVVITRELEPEPPTPAPAKARARTRQKKAEAAGAITGPAVNGEWFTTPDGIRLRSGGIELLHQDPDNLREHNPENIGMIVTALQEVGAARSLVCDDDYKILAGNGTHEAAAEAGIDKIVIVETDGDTLVVVKRDGLSDREKTRLALLDNAASDRSTFNAEGIRGLYLDGEDDEGGLLHGVLHPEEIEAFCDAAKQSDMENAARDDDEALKFDEEPTGPSGKKRIAYRLDFDNAKQKRIFDKFIGWLNRQYGPDDSEAAQFIACLIEHIPQAIGEGGEDEDRNADERES